MTSHTFGLDEVVVYDTEASDKDVRHGQILEFGAVFLDPRSLEEREAIEYDVRLLPYIVPSPEALAVTGFDPESLSASDRLPEHIAMRRIAETMRPRGGIRAFAGWNSGTGGFDDALVRHSMFRCLLDPWLMTGPRARRLDVMTLAQLVHLANPDAILPGAREDGSATWRLSHVAAANGFAFAAHRATADSRATGKILAQCAARATNVVEAFVRCCDGRRMVELTDPSKTQVLYQFTHFGAPKLEPIMPLASDRGSVLAAKLDEDLGSLLDRDAEALAGAMYKAGSPACSFNPKASVPIFTLEEARAMGLDCGDTVAHRRKAGELFQADVGGVAATAQQLSRVGLPEGETAEAKLYSGGLPFQGADRGRTQAFLDASDPSKKIEIAAGLADLRLREFAARSLLVHDGLTGADFIAALGEPRGRRLDELGRRALARPHADSASPWQTIAAARAAAAKTENSSYLAWLADRFGDGETPEVSSEPVEVKAASSPQLSFGF